MKWILLFLVGVSVLLAVQNLSQKKQVIGEKTINIVIADSPSERAKGLSGRSSLGSNDGMLFIFPEEGNYGFWMKDMKFPIDIAWMDKDKKIVHIESRVSPDTYPKVFYPGSLSQYVLEVNAGFFEANNIKAGESSEF